jgi:glycosyltransferase involved in cell wall biosynthesis
MHIAFVSSMSGAPWGGSEELWSQTALRLRQEGHTVSVCVAWWPQLAARVQELEKNGAHIFARKPARHNIPIRIWNKIKRQLVVAERKEFQWLQSRKADLVVISQGGTSDGLEWMSYCAAAGLPYVSIIQCNTEAWYPEDGLGAEMAKAYRSAKNVFCVSQHNLKLLECQLGEKLHQASVVWNAYNVPPQQPPDWPEENGVWKMACVARLEPVAKGQDLLFQVMNQKLWHDRPIELNMYGAGKSTGNLQKLASSLQLKNVHFRGHVNNVQAIWDNNHLLVLPSRFEGLPIALVEAMWCARPCVVTDVGGNAELCVDDETGFVAPAPTARLFEEALERAWKRRHEWHHLGRSAHARAEKLIPKDPVGVFSRQLIGAASNHHA